MKKWEIVLAVLVGLGLGFFAGKFAQERQYRERDEQRCHAQIVFAIDKLQDLKAGYDPDTMEMLIGEVYAAKEITRNQELNAALHELWNALVFDGENVAGKENALISALSAKDPAAIREIAAGMRTKE